MRNFRIDPELEEGLRLIRERDGIAESEQIRRGIQMWLESKRAVKSERKRVAARKRP
jgi:hypothetical protein